MRLRKSPENLRLLVVRLGSMGDILHSLPAVTALRQAHPGWFIGWAIEPQWRGLFAADGSAPGTPGMPLVDQLHFIPTKKWAKSPLSPVTWSEISRARRSLEDLRYDVAVDLQGAVRSAVFARWAHTGRVIGEDHPRESIAKFFFNERVTTRGAHVIEQSLEVANAIAPENLPMTLPLLPHDPAADAQAAQLPQPCVLLSPGAGWGSRRWPAERYGAVARKLADAGNHVVINSGPAEDHLARAIVDSSNGAAKILSLDMAGLIALTRRASLVIAGDTGPLHLACALGTPVVGIFGPTDPARSGPLLCRGRVLRHPESVRDHTRRTEPEAGLLTITPEAVTEAALELLEESR
jgi:heptosyltransferase-1